MDLAEIVTMRTRFLVSAVLFTVSCSGQVGQVAADAPVRFALEEASEAHGVPVSVLAAVGFFGMQLTMPGSTEHQQDGDEAPLLTGDVATRAAGLA